MKRVHFFRIAHSVVLLARKAVPAVRYRFAVPVITFHGGFRDE